MRHDADAGRILVDEDVVRPAVRAAAKDVRRAVDAVVTRRDGNRLHAGYDRRLEPRGQLGVEERVADEVGRPRLQPAVSELLPSWLGGRGDLKRRVSLGVGLVRARRQPATAFRLVLV